MNLALSTVLIFLIILPGLIARLSYFTYPFANKARATDFTKEVFWSIIPGFFIQFIYIGIVEKFSGLIIHFRDIAFLIAGKEDNIRLNKIALNIHSHTGHILLYFLGLLLLSSIIGWGLKKIVFSLMLDKYRLFRFNNKWYYILSGRLIDIENLDGKSSDIDLVFIDVLCRVGDKNIIYIGILKNYYLSDNGDLDALTLQYPIRRGLEDDRKGDEKHDVYYEIPSAILYIPNKDIININVRYISLE